MFILPLLAILDVSLKHRFFYPNSFLMRLLYMFGSIPKKPDLQVRLLCLMRLNIH